MSERVLSGGGLLITRNAENYTRMDWATKSHTSTPAFPAAWWVTEYMIISPSLYAMADFGKFSGNWYKTVVCEVKGGEGGRGVPYSE